MDIEGLANQAAAAVQQIHSGAATPEILAAARELQAQISRHSSVVKLTILLADAQRPSPVQHFGFQVLLTALKARPPQLSDAARSEVREWLAALILGRAGAFAPFVRAKCAEVVAEVARVDWPLRWPQLKTALLASAASASAELASLALSVWCHIADLLLEDSKELTAPRRRELESALTGLVMEPASAPELIASLQQTLRQHGADGTVVRCALALCRALVIAVPVQALLKHSLDQIIRVGLDLDPLRSEAVVALAQWAERMFPVSSRHYQPETHDLCRFSALLVQVARRCVFDGTAEGYDFHRQVAELFSDYCSANAEHLVYALPSSDFGALLSALVYLARYPSCTVQLDALHGMVQLAKATACSGSASATSAMPNLEELVGLLFILSIKKELMPTGGPSADRSTWLLKCLGSPSCSAPVLTYQAWVELERHTLDFDMRDGTDGSIVGDLKVQSRDLLLQICNLRGDMPDNDCYGQLCRTVSLFVAHSLTSGGSSAAGTGEIWVAEFDAALSLIERIATTTLKSAKQLELVLKPSLPLLKQVTMPAAGFSCALEFRRMEFLSHWAPLYKHYEPEISGQILQRLLSVVEVQPSGNGDEIKLHRRALDGIISLGKHGALRPPQLESLNAECQRIGAKLNPTGRCKLVEALAAAVAGCPDLDIVRRSQIICGLMEQPTAAWMVSPLVSSSGAEPLLSTLCASASSRPGGVGEDAEGNFDKLRDVRTLLTAFAGVVTKTMVQDYTCSGGQQDLVPQLVQAWAPHIFSFSMAMASATAVVGSSDVALLLLSRPSHAEVDHVLGQGKGRETVPEVIPPQFHARAVHSTRGMLYELQTNLIHGVRACCWSPSFWDLPEAAPLVRGLLEMLPKMRLHVANTMLKEVFMPLFGVPRPTKPSPGLSVVPLQAQASVCEIVVPALVGAIRHVLRQSWCSGGGAHSSDELAELMHATSSIAFARTAATILSGLSGEGLLIAGFLANPERRWFAKDTIERLQAPTPVQGTVGRSKKAKNRGKNSFAALADDENMDVTKGSSQGDQEPEVPMGAALHVFRSRLLRDEVRQGLVDLLCIPEAETMRRTLRGLYVWTAQLWNAICRGEDPASISATPVQELTAGDLLHAAADALRALPSGILKPLLQVVARPPSLSASALVSNGASPSGDRPLVVAPTASVVSLAATDWSVAVSPTIVHGKKTPSLLVQQCSPPVRNAILIIVKLFKIQCFKVDLRSSLEHVYLCPPLGEIMKQLQGLPNTTLHDVQTVLNAMLAGSSLAEMHSDAVRVMLHEASPAFASESQGDA